MEDAIGIVTLYTFAAAAVAFPLFIIVQSVWNMARASDGRATIVLKAILVLGVWVILSLIFVFIPIMMVFEPGRGVDAATANRRVTILFGVLTLIYIAIGLGLGYWVRLQPGWKTLSEEQKRERGGV
jgi:formate hydrogenlyase subunit 3/multisubunit Na+/H+ antiporter MnhD subunit